MSDAPRTGFKPDAPKMIDSDELRRRGPVLAAIGALDEEGFSNVVWMINQQAKTAGGFGDKVGWLAVRNASDAYIADLESRH